MQNKVSLDFFSRVPAKLLTGEFFTPASSISYHHFYHNSYTLDGSHIKRFTGRNNVFPYFVKSTEIREVSYLRHVSVTNQALFVFFALFLLKRDQFHLAKFYSHKKKCQ